MSLHILFFSWVLKYIFFYGSASESVKPGVWMLSCIFRETSMSFLYSIFFITPVLAHHPLWLVLQSPSYQGRGGRWTWHGECKALANRSQSCTCHQLFPPVKDKIISHLNVAWEVKAHLFTYASYRILTFLYREPLLRSELTETARDKHLHQLQDIQGFSWVLLIPQDRQAIRFVG